MQGSLPKMFEKKPRSYSPLRRQLLGQRSIATSFRLAILILLILVLSICHLDTNHFTNLPLYASTAPAIPRSPPALLQQPADSLLSPPASPPASSSSALIGTSSFSSTSSSATTAEGKDAPLKVALITFTTSQTSYTHLSLSNHAAYASKHPSVTFLPQFAVDNARDVMWGKFDMITDLIKQQQYQAVPTYDWIWWLDFDTLITNTSISISDIITSALADTDASGGNSEQVDYLFTTDCAGLNAGSFLVRAAPRALDFVDMIDSYYVDMQAKGQRVSEQDCMAGVLFPSSSHDSDEDGDGQVESITTVLPSAYARRFGMLEQRAINAFPEEIGCYEEREVTVSRELEDENGEVVRDENGKVVTEGVRETREVGKWREGDFVVHMAGAWAHVQGEDAAGRLMKKYAGFVDVGEGDDGDVRVVVNVPGWGQ